MAQGTKLVVKTQRDLDECAIQWNKTRNPIYYEAWFQGVKHLASLIPQNKYKTCKSDWSIFRQE